MNVFIIHIRPFISRSLTKPQDLRRAEAKRSRAEAKSAANLTQRVHVIGFMIFVGKQVKAAWPKPGQLPMSDVVVADRF